MRSSRSALPKSVAATLWLPRMLMVGLATGCLLGLDPMVYDEDSGNRGIPFGGDTEFNDTGLSEGESGSGSGGSDEGGSDEGGTGSDSGGDSGSDSGSDSGGSSGDSGGTSGDSGGSGGSGSDSGSSSGGSGGGSGGSTPSSPILSGLSATDLGGQVEVEFVASDADEDLLGGYFILDVDGAPLHYDIPSDLGTFTDGGTSTAYFDPGLSACESSSMSLTAHVEDATGLTSSDRSASVTASGDGTVLSELGDDSGAAQDLGNITTSTDFCGDLYSVVFGYGGDEDWMYFTVGSGGSWVIELTWDASNTDYDIYLFDALTGEVLNSGITESYTPREIMTQALQSGRTYYIAITAWEGSAADYSLQIR